jgi:7-dehydrocholesterol reductase
LISSFWATIFLKLKTKIYKGPTAPNGYTPTYVDNGFMYYIVTTSAFLLLNFATSYQISIDIYQNIVHIICSLNLFAFLLCVFLCFAGTNFPQQKETFRDDVNILFKFYRGIELHPRIFGVDIKQFTNCRMGLMIWQILIMAYLFVSIERNGWNSGMAVNVILQSVYIAKFFWWETGYFTTLDITLDRAGYYLCWGCLVYVPSFYTFSTYYLVHYPPIVSETFSLIVLLAGLLCIYFNYDVDYQKMLFRMTKGECKFWGRTVSYINAEYKDAKGVHKTKFLISGYWGLSRHLNYVFEIGLSLCWSLPGLGRGIYPFLYTVYITILLLHRIFRDEDKCFNKYGNYWKLYCEKVRYRLIPFVF